MGLGGVGLPIQGLWSLGCGIGSLALDDADCICCFAFVMT